MEKLNFDAGIQEYDLGFGVPLRVNFSDPNLYERFLSLTDRIMEIAKGYDGMEAAGGEDYLKFLRDADRKVKEVLNDTFGLGNDFDKIMGGTNMMAVATNGNLIVTNFIDAITPVMQDGIDRFTDSLAESVRKQK